ncbi:MAG: tetratricopeptide repeat protein [Candidatus Aminicenantes bacterium]|nr:tetratricopeptide repeat protein [Candidatus Aminicenantes bacterium]
MKGGGALLALCAALTACAPSLGPSLGPPLPADYRVLLGTAHDHLQARECDAAEAVLKRAVSLRPAAAEAHNLLGIAHFLRENLRAAEECFLTAIRLRNDYSAAHSNLANVRFLQGRFGPARESFKTAIALSPDSAAAHYGLATLLFAQGKHEEGLRSLARGIALDPDYFERNKGFSAGAAVGGLLSPETYYAWAKAYAIQGHAAKSVAFLRKAGEAGFKNWKRLDSDSEFDAIRESPEFLLFRRNLKSAPSRQSRPSAAFFLTQALRRSYSTSPHITSPDSGLKKVGVRS